MADPEKPRRRRRKAPEAEARAAAESEADADTEARADTSADTSDDDDDAAPAIAAKSAGAPLAALEERAPRQTLLIGAGLLVVGLAIVGTGLGGMGSVVALVGLVAVIYGIHAFGRLGAEDLTPDSPDVVARSSATVRLALGVLIALVGLTVAIAGYLGLAPAGSIETAVITFVAGGFWALRAAMALAPAKKTRRPA